MFLSDSNPSMSREARHVETTTNKKKEGVEEIRASFAEKLRTKF